MIRSQAFAGLLLSLPVIAIAQGTITDRAVLGQIPGIPGTAQLAYAMYVDSNGDLKPGPPFEAYGNLVKAAEAQRNAAAMAGQQTQIAAAQQMQQRFGSPEGQAELQNMTLAQKMALAQQMSASRPVETVSEPPSAQDIELIKRIGSDHLYKDDLPAVQRLELSAQSLEQQWRADIEKSRAAEGKELAAIPESCRPGGDIAIQPPDKVRAVHLAYDDARIALAGSYLEKSRALEQTLRAAAGIAADDGDGAIGAWAQLHEASLKAHYRGLAQGQQNAGLGEVGKVSGFVEDVTRAAAEAIVERQRDDRLYPGGHC